MAGERGREAHDDRGAVEAAARERDRRAARGVVAYGVHLRHVFLRTGLTERDELSHMWLLRAHSTLGAQGNWATRTWDIGRLWCAAKHPDCANCPLVAVCPRLIERGDQVRGI